MVIITLSIHVQIIYYMHLMSKSDLILSAVMQSCNVDLERNAPESRSDLY